MPHRRAGKHRVHSTPSDRRGIIRVAALCTLCRCRHKVHSTGHEKRLKRQSITERNGFGSDPYCKEELIAELGSAFLCGQAGIVERTIDDSAAYLQAWLKRLQEDKTLIVYAAAQAQKAADFILGRTFESEAAT